MPEGINSETIARDKSAPELRLKFGLFTLFLAIIFLLFFVLLFAVGYEPLRIPFAATAESLVANYVPFNYVVFAAAGMLIAAILVHLVWRKHLFRTKALKSDYECPNCGQYELIRMHRRRSDKAAGALTHLPAYRYACRSCNWQGLMLPAPSRKKAHLQESSPAGVPGKQATGEDYRDQPQVAAATIDSVAREEVEGSVNEPAFTAVSEDGHEPSQELSEIDDVQDLKPELAHKNVAAAAPVSVTEYGELTLPKIHVVARAMIVAPYGLKLYDRPTNHAIVLRELKSGDVVDICKNQDVESPSTWRYVAAEGDVGWVSAAFLKRIQNADGTSTTL